MSWLLDLAKEKGFLELPELIAHLESGGDGGRRFWTFDQLPLRPIELAREDLFPGIPEELQRPGGPPARLTWWHGAPGAGKTLVGWWLAARHGWTFLPAATWKEAAGQLPESGNVFVELEDATDLHLTRMELSGARRLCIAAAGPPPSPAAADGREGAHERRSTPWTLITTPPQPSWVRRLIDWVADRIEEGGGFDRREVHRLFDEESLEEIFGTPGDLLGFLGTLDRAGIAALREALQPSADPLRLVRAWWKLTRERTDREKAAAKNAHVRAHGVELLVAMERARLRGGRARRLPAAVWADLASQVDQEGASAPAPLDAARLREVLEQRSKEEALELLDHSGAGVVASLRGLGVLHGDPAGLEVRPSWVAYILREAAIARLSGDSLGTLLLNPETAEEVLLGLYFDVYAGRVERVRRAVEEAARGTAAGPRSAEEVAALDGAFRAIGLALAVGAEVPLELVRAAWQRQAAYLALRYEGWPEIPILSMAAPRGERGVTSRGAWFVAALALSKQLTDAGSPPDPIAGLTPWGREEPLDAAEQQKLGQALEQAVSALHHQGDEGEPWGALPFALGEQLLDCAEVGLVRSAGRIAEAQQPALLVRLSQYEDVELSDDERRDLLTLPWGLQVLEASCRRHAVALDDVLRWCWGTWGKGGSPRWPPMRDDPQLDLERLWSLAPAEALAPAVLEQLPRWPWAWRALSDEGWRRWLDQWEPLKDLPERQLLSMFAVMPAPLMLDAVREGRLTPYNRELRAVLWTRLPRELLALVDELARSTASFAETAAGPDGPLPELVYSAPHPITEELITRAAAWLEAPGDYPGIRPGIGLGGGPWPRRWLLHVIERRLPGWRRALELAIPAATSG